MDISFRQLVLRRIAFLIVVVGFCLLPGPRSLISDTFGFLVTPESIHSFAAGLHLSLIHFCWLFGLEMPSWEYAEQVDPQLAALALFMSAIFQVCVFSLLVYAWNAAMHRYNLRRAELEERAEFGDFET